MLHEFWLILNFVKSLLIALINLIYKGESVCVCVSGIKIHIVGPILTKFGMGASLYRGQVIGYVSAPGVDPQGQWALNRVWRASTAATVRLGKIFMKQKL